MVKQPRAGWPEAMKRMAAAGDDAPLIPDDLDAGSWAGKSIWDMDKKEIEKFFGEAAQKAIKETHAAGQPTTHADEDGRIYRLYPDGRREYEDGSGPVPPRKIR